MKLLHLQGLRGLAIIAVTLFHFFPKQFSNGYLGVDIFFALSGYLMTMMMSKYQKVGVREVFEFLYRRVKRIVPLYYLCTLLTILALIFLPVSLKRANLQPSMDAVIFTTNLIQKNKMEGYFEKLGVAVDLFAHTWSLSLEMQFYILFPIIFALYRIMPSELLATVFLAVISLASFLYYSFRDDFISFNSVFSRIWQFNAGMFVFTITHTSTPPVVDLDADSAELIEKQPEDCRTWNSNSFYTLACIIALMASPELVFDHFGRLMAIIATMELFHHGSGCPFLKNKVLVFVGEISYAWYLVHWPFAAYCRLLAISNTYHILIIYFLTLLISIFLHLTFERTYLKWEKSLILTYIVFLLVSNAVGIYAIGVSLPREQLFANSLNEMNNSLAANLSAKPFNWPSDFMDGWKGGYENYSIQNRTAINEANQANDLKRTLLQTYCKNFTKTNNTLESRCIFTEGLNKKSPLKLLVIGNSFAPNLFPVIFDECKANFSHMEISYCGGCEVFARTNNGEKGNYYDCRLDWFFLKAVKQVQPDVLFIVQRYFKMLEIVKGNNPFDDLIFKTASERLGEIQKHVKRRIFILDDFPETGDALTAVVNYLKKNTTINDAKLNHQGFGNTVVRMRTQRLASECPKCKLFDYTPQFYFNGKFKFYDPNFFISFITYGRHLTPEGKERVRPIIKHLCRNF